MARSVSPLCLSVTCQDEAATGCHLTLAANLQVDKLIETKGLDYADAERAK